MGAIRPVTETVGMLTSDKFQSHLRSVLPKHLPPERQLRIAISAIKSDSKLGQCDPKSVVSAVIECSQLGLEPNGALQHAHLIPFGNFCQIVIGYRGLIELARRSGEISTIMAQVVYSNDDFDFEFGLEPKLRHRPAEGDRGYRRYVWAAATLKDGGYQFEVLTEADIQKTMGFSRSAQRKDSPWQQHTDDMWRKTAIRRLCKLLPCSVELQTALALEDHIDMGEKQEFTIDLTPAEDKLEDQSKAAAERARDAMQDHFNNKAQPQVQQPQLPEPKPAPPEPPKPEPQAAQPPPAAEKPPEIEPNFDDLMGDGPGDIDALPPEPPPMPKQPPKRTKGRKSRIEMLTEMRDMEECREIPAGTLDQVAQQCGASSFVALSESDPIQTIQAIYNQVREIRRSHK